MSKKWCTYIITNYSNSVFYTGVTNNLIKRVYEHKQGFIKNSFSSRYKLYKLVWFEEFSSPIEGIEAEKRVKDWRREKKINLIKSKNPQFQDLSALRYISHPASQGSK